MKRMLNHSAMPVVGYIEPWSIKAGFPAGAFISCVDPLASYRVVSLDRDVAEVQAWTVDKNHAVVNQSFSLGSFISLPSLPIGDAGGWELEFEFLLTKNEVAKPIVHVGEAGIWVDQSGTVYVKFDDRTVHIGTALNECWYTLRLTISSGGLECLLHSSVGDEKAVVICELITASSVVQAFIGSTGDDETKTLNGRIGRIAARIGDQRYNWQFPTRGPVTSLGALEDDAVRLNVHNMPTFAVASARFDSCHHDPRLAPSHFDAIHLHDDDFGGFDWPATLTISVPEDARSGVFALEVTTSRGVEKLPFFVRPKKPEAELAFLAPTSTYLSYADERLPPTRYPWHGSDRGHLFAIDNDFLCLYDVHSDLSGVSLTSSRRPRATLRDDYHYPLSDCPHLLPVDLQLLKFYAREGVAVDVLTDRDLHDDGNSAIASYKGLLTGSHPEYWSTPMMTALHQYLDSGGNLAYLGGNGFYWVVAYQDETMELRRVKSDIWTGRPGEAHMSITGEPGGNWEDRGLKNPQSYLGVTYLIMSFGPSKPYHRLEGSFHDDYRWLFEGVTDDPIGDSGSVLGGAAGYEIDAVVRSEETPRNLVRLATADGFDESFQVRPDVWLADGDVERESLRRADMTIYHHAGGGHVFCTGSVGWIGALPKAGEQNNVGIIMKNLAEGFQK